VPKQHVFSTGKYRKYAVWNTPRKSILLVHDFSKTCGDKRAIIVDTMEDYVIKSRKVNVGEDGSTPKMFLGKKGASKTVTIGEDGATPKKLFPVPPSKRVNIGLEGQTPKKVVNADGTTKSYSFSKKVNVGSQGETPIKTFEYYGNIPVAAAPNKAQFSSTVPALSKVSHISASNEFMPPPPGPSSVSSARSASSAENFMQVYPEMTEVPSPNSRPKTSRGVSHPSPDEFFDYIVPSPPLKGKSIRSFSIVDEAIPHVPKAAIKHYSSDEFGLPGAMGASANVRDGQPRDTNGRPAVPHAAEVLEVDKLASGDESGAGELEYSEYDADDGDAEGDYGAQPEDSGAEFYPQMEGEDLFGAGSVDAEESVYDVRGADTEGAAEEPWEAQQQRHIHMSGNDEHRNKQIRMLGCWLFGSALRI
jgi:hypothetical protein